MVQSVSYGFYLTVCLAAAGAAFFRYGIRGKLIVMPIAALLLAAAFLTQTRSVWMGTALVLLILSATLLGPRLRKVVIGSAVCAGLFLVAFKFESLVGFEREGSVQATKSSAECRGAFAVVSWYMFLDRPFFGHGFGNFPDGKLPYLDQMRDYDLVMDEIRPLIHHNTYLNLLTELGLLGLLLYLGILFGWGRCAYALLDRSRYPAWCRDHGIVALGGLGSYLIQMMFHEVTFTSIDNALIFFLSGIASGLIVRPPEGVRHDLGRRTDARVLREWIGGERHPDLIGTEARI
ncbi:MAG: O-antigen ligase family protein [Pirellulales bacterium]